MSNGNEEFDLKEKIRKGRVVNAAIDAMEKKHEEELQPLQDLKKAIYGQIKDHMIAANMLSSKTEEGQAVMAHKKSYRVENQSEFMHHIIGTEDWETIVWAVKRSAAEAFENANNGAMIPGVAKTEILELRLLAPEKKRVRKPTVVTSDDQTFDPYAEEDALADTIRNEKEENNG
jgi:hypothetical protein